MDNSGLGTDQFGDDFKFCGAVSGICKRAVGRVVRLQSGRIGNTYE